MSKPRGRPRKQSPVIEISNDSEDYNSLKENGLLDEYYYENTRYEKYRDKLYLYGIYICRTDDIWYYHC